MRGFGLDLADLREYQYHDDVRYIDWNVTARLQTPYVREYNEDRDVTAWFLLDLSPSVNFGSRTVKKASLATEGAGHRFRRYIPPLLFLAALAVMIAAVARPACLGNQRD